MTTGCCFPGHFVLRGQQGGVTVREMPGEAAGRLCKFSASSICSCFGIFSLSAMQTGNLATITLRYRQKETVKILQLLDTPGLS